MSPESQLRDLLEEFLEWTLEPRLRRQIDAGDIGSQLDFDEALLPTALLRGVIDEWESDIKAELGYEALPVMGRGGDDYDPLTPEGRERWLTDLCMELDVTREQLGKMDLDAIFRRIRDA